MLMELPHQCNRLYPCNHCTRRRRPEECVYHSPPVPQTPIDLPAVITNRIQTSYQAGNARVHVGTEDASAFPSELELKSDGLLYEQRSALLESFGYSEDSNSNTMALLKSVRGPITFFLCYISSADCYTDA